MNRFILEKLTVFGGNHKESSINFCDGFNLIIGPSNTGKSLIVDCIDYIFGFNPRAGMPSKIVDNNNGYTHISLTLKTFLGLVTLTRKIGTTTIVVDSTDMRIKSGNYSSSKSSKRCINNIFLELIGIHDTHRILSSQKGSTHKLTWRTILHLFLMKQNEISRESSPLINPYQTAQTASIAALLFILTKKDPINLEKVEKSEIIDAKRNAIINYIKNKKEILETKKETLKNLLDGKDICIFQNISNNISIEIDNLQSELDIASKQSKKIINNLYKQNKKLSECDTLIDSFNSLSKQYNSDIKRLELIVDGYSVLSKENKIECCPFCNSKVEKELSSDYVEASFIELDNLSKNIIGLEKAQKSILERRNNILDKIEKLEKEKEDIDLSIKNNLIPKLEVFKRDLEENLKVIRLKDELDILELDENQLKKELLEKENESKSEKKYNIKEFFNSRLIDEYEKILIRVLEECNIGYSKATKLDIKAFDIEIDSKSKASSTGGGYCSILNTLIVYAMNTFIYSKGGYAPKFFIIDSAITQLSEVENIKETDSIKYNFIKFLENNALNRQVIMIEHKEKLPYIPKEDLKNGVHIIEFTKDKNRGQYGFLNDVFNLEDKEDI